MGCPCQDKKKNKVAAGASPVTTYRIRLINWTLEPSTYTGKASGVIYGDKKNGDEFKVRIEDYDAEPEMFVQL